MCVCDDYRRKHTLIASHTNHLDPLQEVFLGGHISEHGHAPALCTPGGLARESVNRNTPKQHHHFK